MLHRYTCRRNSEGRTLQVDSFDDDRRRPIAAQQGETGHDTPFNLGRVPGRQWEGADVDPLQNHFAPALSVPVEIYCDSREAPRNEQPLQLCRPVFAYRHNRVTTVCETPILDSTIEKTIAAILQSHFVRRYGNLLLLMKVSNALRVS